jgi:circadian clock protein KaiB
LFVTGMSVSSVRAITNINNICETYIKGDFTLEIIDIYKQPGVLQQYDIIVCPTLLKIDPKPVKKLVGDLSNIEKVLSGLGIRTA